MGVCVGSDVLQPLRNCMGPEPIIGGEMKQQLEPF
jgi:hypothetical protein